ncbi:MAG: GTP 3',8-cyclase MoaA [Saprospiraceae bacterium]
MLIDNHGRLINYMRLAVTDRCNLRCFYCMPKQGITYAPKKELMSFAEMYRIVDLFSQQGIEKIRITGGEPFLWKDMMTFLQAISNIPGLKKIGITTNGTLIHDKIDKLQGCGVNEVNLSLDSIDPERFCQITRRDDFSKVMESMNMMIDAGIHVKINMVVMNGRNIEDIIPMLEMTKDKPISVRYIEEMPFNGTKGQGNETLWAYKQILDHIKMKYPDIQKIPDPPFSTSMSYKVRGFVGSFGVIAAYSRTFCGTCNRIRLTPKGVIKTCLYDNGIFNIKSMMRSGANNEEIIEALKSAIAHKAKNGHEAENRRKLAHPVSESMATIGG